MNPEVLAVLAAVARCVEETEESEKTSAGAGAPAARPPSPWALHGRQGIMRMRELVQRRVLKR
jgi:hypothetical protein